MQHCYVIHPHFARAKVEDGRTAAEKLEEAVNLIQAIDLNLVGSESVSLKKRHPAHLFGQGTVDRLKQIVQEEKIDILVVNGMLSPIQQRNLEKTLNTKVIDRTALILEIFGARAKTREGVLQVELAALTYQRSRLVRSWTHLERQRGGAGFLGGPGESQLELDRRIIDEKVEKIQQALEKVQKTRALHRHARQRVPYPIVALVGYTNAGKSTLFNRLTKADVFAQDLLFATLDPTMRLLKLPSGEKVILSDTVGFISDLPTLLVAAFRATLEEVLEADLIVHVQDVSHPERIAQRHDVEKVLSALGVHERTRLWNALNKSDRLEPEEHARFERHLARRERCSLLSAYTGQGVDPFLHHIDTYLTREWEAVSGVLHASQGKELAWLQSHGHIVAQQYEEDQCHLTVRLRAQHVQQAKNLLSC